MDYEKPVFAGVQAIRELGTQLDADLDTSNGGFTWWHGYNLDADTLTGIMDYLCGLVGAVRANLRSAAVHLADLTELRYTDTPMISGSSDRPDEVSVVTAPEPMIVAKPESKRTPPASYVRSARSSTP